MEARQALEICCCPLTGRLCGLMSFRYMMPAQLVSLVVIAVCVGLTMALSVWQPTGTSFGCSTTCLHSELLLLLLCVNLWTADVNCSIFTVPRFPVMYYQQSDTENSHPRDLGRKFTHRNGAFWKIIRFPLIGFSITVSNVSSFAFRRFSWAQFVNIILASSSHFTKNGRCTVCAYPIILKELFH